MVRYLKYIVAVFGSIGIIVASFFYYQNRVDISQVFAYRGTIDYRFQLENCKEMPNKDYTYPCLKKEFEKFLKGVSLTGTSMGLKMMFNVMDEDKANTTLFTDIDHRNIAYALNYLEVNNLAMNNAYRRYFGFDSLYGGFVASLDNFYSKAYVFSDNLIIGLNSQTGIKSLKNEELKTKFKKRFEELKNHYYSIKEDVEKFKEVEEQKLSSQNK